MKNSVWTSGGQDAPETFDEALGRLEEQARGQADAATGERAEVLARLEAVDAQLADLQGRREQIASFRTRDRGPDDTPADLRDPLEVFGQRVRFLRQVVFGMSREEFAAQLGVSVPTVQNWEQGLKRIGQANLEALAAYVGLAPDVLWPSATPPVRRTDVAEARARRADRGREPAVVDELVARIAALEERLAALTGDAPPANALERELAAEAARARPHADADGAGTPGPRRRAQPS